METIIAGNGCFWCTESIFQQIAGVEKVESGYCGGTVEAPSYEQVCSGQTGHAEVLRITYNPEKVSLADLLKVFFETHDPTTLNRQGHDVGTQYRSILFYANEPERQLITQYIDQLSASKVFSSPIVTAVEPAQPFYKAESYHDNYLNLHGENPYCEHVIRPKLKKFLASPGVSLKLN